MVLNLLDLDEPKAPDPHDPEHHAGQCRRCHRPLSAEESLGYSIGPTCRKHLGITSRQPVRLARTKPGGDCQGQTDLLEET